MKKKHLIEAITKAIVTHERRTGKPATELQQLRNQLKGKKR